MRQSATSMERLAWLRLAAYPGTVAVAACVLVSLTAAGVPVLTAGYVGAVTGAVLVTLLEFVIPYERTWRPTLREVGNDLAFMVAVQLVLPRALVLLAGVTLIDASGGAPAAFLWPHHWPAPAQVVLMLLTAEFFRYWLHRAAHHTPLLWRLHAVHHSPQRLYWLNVGRFHPVEKTLQFTLDTLPFMLVGVGEPVLAGYLVFYSVNGFFQHSNVDARYGFLNYVVSGAELHRWHHSMVAAESNNNYGNNLIVFDLAFGTWFLPRGRRVGDLGLLNRAYPDSFWSQMTTPLTPRLDKRSPDD